MHKTIILIGCSMALLSGCGTNVNSANLFDVQTDSQIRTPCPNPTPGFYVCLDAESTFYHAGFKDTIMTAMASINQLVNQNDFQSKVESNSGGADVINTLTETNYIVLVNGYCDSTSNVLAEAAVGGTSIQYNECIVRTDNQGNADNAQVSGVMLHEISHNLGYSHAEVNPSPNSVPYYLGNLAESMLSPTGNSSSTNDASAVSSNTYTSPVSSSTPIIYYNDNNSSNGSAGMKVHNPNGRSGRGPSGRPY